VSFRGLPAISYSERRADRFVETSSVANCFMMLSLKRVHPGSLSPGFTPASGFTPMFPGPKVRAETEKLPVMIC
jgi:hypothetical protein